MTVCLKIELLFAIFTPIFVFLLGEFFIWFRNQKALRSEIKSYKETILIWISLIDEPIKIQIEALEKFVEQIKSQDIYPVSLGSCAILADKVDNLALERYISTFIINSKIKKKKAKYTLPQITFSIVSQFHFLTLIETEIKETHSDYKQYFENIKKEWFVYWQQLSDDLKEYSVPIHNEFPDFLKKIKTSEIQKCKNIKDLEPIINSLLEITQDEFRKNPHNNYAISLFSTIQQLQKLRMDWNAGIEGYANLFQAMIERIKNTYETLTIAKEFIEMETDLKCFIKLKN